MRTLYSATAFAPATSANMSVGFDMLGFAIDGLGDEVKLTRRVDDQLIIQSQTGHPDAQTLPTAIQKNTAGIVIEAMQKYFNLDYGFDIEIKKGIAIGSGLGGSAASAVAAAFAVNAFLDKPLSNIDLAQWALEGEVLASGHRHGDNIVPCALGGLQLVLGVDPIKQINLPAPKLCAVLVHPHICIETKAARAVMPKAISLDTVIQQNMDLAGAISALYTQDEYAFAGCLKDHLIEPYRKDLIPGFDAVKTAAVNSGALSVGISGAGPTLFALALNKSKAQLIAESMQGAFKHINLDSDVWISELASPGARILSTELN